MGINWQSSHNDGIGHILDSRGCCVCHCFYKTTLGKYNGTRSGDETVHSELEYALNMASASVSSLPINAIESLRSGAIEYDIEKVLGEAIRNADHELVATLLAVPQTNLLNNINRFFVRSAAKDLDIYMKLLDCIPDISEISVGNRLLAVRNVVLQGSNPRYVRTRDQKIAIVDRILDGISVTPGMVFIFMLRKEYDVASVLVRHDPSVVWLIAKHYWTHFTGMGRPNIAPKMD